MNTFKAACSLYAEQFLMVLVLLLGFVLPIQLIHHFSLGNFAYMDWAHTPLLVKIMEVGLYLFEIWLVQIPFITLATQKGKGQKATPKEVRNSTVAHFIPVLAVGILYSLGVLMGLALLILPGCILLIVLLLFPHVVMFEGLTVKLALKRAFYLGKVHFLQIALLIFSFLSVEILLSVGLHYGLGQQTQLTIFLLLRLVLQGLVLPLYVFMVTLYYAEWSKVVSPEQILQEQINDRIRAVFKPQQQP